MAKKPPHGPIDFEDEYDDRIPDLNEVFQDENDLKKKLQAAEKKLVKFREEQEKDLEKIILKEQATELNHKRALLTTCEYYEKQIEALKQQIRELWEKNHEIHENSKLFIKGLEHLSRDGSIITTTHEWKRNGAQTLADRVKTLTGPGTKTRIVSITPLITNPRGEVVVALIVTEHFERFKIH